MFGNSFENQTKGSKNNIVYTPQVQVIVSTDPQKTDVVSTTTSPPNRNPENIFNSTIVIEKNATGNSSSIIKKNVPETANLIVSQKPPTKQKLFIRYSSSSALVISKNSQQNETTFTTSGPTTPQVSKFNIDDTSLDDKDLLYNNSEKSFDVNDETNSVRRPSSLLNSGGIICRPMLREQSPNTNTLLQNISGYSKGCRRKSMHTSAFNNTIGLRPIKSIDRRASQPLLQCSKIENDKSINNDVNCIDSQNLTIKNKKKDTIDSNLKINGIDKISGKGFLTKRVSWMSMKSLLEGNDTLSSFFSKSKNSDNTYCVSSNRSETRSNSQYESNVNLNETFDLENDTPPLETMSWSNAGL